MVEWDKGVISWTPIDVVYGMGAIIWGMQGMLTCIRACNTVDGHSCFEKGCSEEKVMNTLICGQFIFLETVLYGRACKD